MRKTIGRRALIITLIAALLCIAVAVGIVFIREARLSGEQNELLSELDSRAGEYDESSIVLRATSKAKAEKLAERFGARLRITSDGKYATLTLSEGVSIRDICADKENRAYLSQITPDYKASISDIDEISEKYVRPTTTPNYSISDDGYDLQNYLRYLNIGDAWQNYRGDGVTVAVIDTGIDTDHPEFAGRISEYSYNATYDKIVKDYTAADGGYDWSLVEDAVGHGTAVMGVIAAAMDGQGTVGIAPQVNIIVIKAECDANGRFLRGSDLVFGLYYAIERDVDVVNMSFGGGGDFSAPVRLGVDSDILMVAAAGNDSTSAPQQPASCEGVIGVGALEADGWNLAYYSNFGENTNLVAPGTVYTAAAGGGYRTMNGTSFASPIVAAALALMKSNGEYKYSSNEVLEEILYASCYDLGDLGPDFYYGYGALDISALLLEEKGTVTFNMLTDELENTTQVFIRSHTLQNMPEPERLYAVFDGWYYDIHCTEEYNWYEDEFNSDITLYANWVNEDDGVPFTYVTLDDGTIEIRSYTGKRRYITVPEEIEGKAVSSIGEFAFKGETRLREVRLPSRLRRIRTGAFAGCTNLYKIDIPASVTEIGASAFSNAVRLGTLAIPADSSLISIGDEAFANCAKLRRVDIPASLERVNGSAFFGTTSNMEINVASKNKHFVSIDGVLFNYTKSMIVAYPAGRTASYTVPENVRYIGSCAFAYTKASSVDLGSVTEIGGSAFAASSLSAVVIPDTVISMGQYAFQSSAYLSSVKIGNGLRSISKEAFEYCSNLSEITIPSGIESIGGAAFKFAGLGKLIFENNSRLKVIAGAAFYKCPLTSVDFPDSLMNIGDSAFSECFSLSSISFGEGSSLQSIGDAAFRYASLATVAFPANIRTIGDYAFADTAIAGSVTIPASLESLGGGVFGACHALTEIKVESGNKIYADIDGVVYTKDGKAVIAYPAGNPAENYTVLDGTQKIGVAAFYGSWNLRGVAVPAGVDEFYEYAFFDCEKVYGYSLPDTLETVGPYSMAKNYSLSSVSLPDSVINIGRYAFAYDSSLYTVYISDTSKLARISFASFALAGIQTMRIPANVSTVAQYAFEGCKQLTSVTFAAGSKLQSISAYFFLGCDSIQNITFENGSALTSIQAHGLEGMKNLTSIDFGDARLTNIDNYAFRYCSSLATLNLPDTLINIGRFAFYKCTALSSLTVPETIEHIGSYAFHGTDNCALYFSGAELPFYLDENWDDGLSGYYVGVSQTVESGDWKYAILKNGKTAILEYLGNEKNIDLRTLNIGEITTIGGYAFYGKNLESIILPESLTQIQRYAFAENTALAGITIPANVKYIAKYAFHNTGIMNLTFTGSNVSVIEQYAFAYTRKLTSVTLPAGIVKLGTYVFYRSGIESALFAAGTTLTEIPEGAFSGTKLAEVTIPDSVTLVNHNAFRDCTALCRLTLGTGENLRLMSNVFYNTSLAAVHIPANVEYIGEYCFVGLRSLSAFTVDAANPYYTALGGLLYSKDERKIIAAPAGITGTLYVPKSTEVIGFGAFENSLADSIVFDSASNILSFGYRAFYGAKNLREVTIPATVVAIDYYAFAQCSNLETVKFEEGSRLAGIYEGAFFGCGKLKNIILADNIVEISDYAFYGCTSLTEIPVSDTSMIKGIYSYAFAYSGICGNFATPKTLIDIGDYAFRGTKITSAFIPDDNKLDLIIGIGVFEECEVMEKIDVPFLGASYGDEDIYWIGYIFGAGAPNANATYIPQSLRTYIAHEGGNTMTNVAYIKAAETKIENITLPEGMTEIGNSAFSGCGSLTSIEIPDGVTSIGGSAFYGCSSLASIAMPDSVMSIGGWAFYRCSNLTSITVPDGVTSIGNRAFDNCSSLVSITIPDSVTSIGDYAFYNCKSLTSIRIPDGVTVIGNYTFSSCESLTNITIPNGVTSIGDETFYGCNNLASITMPYGVTSIGNAAFQYCYSLTSITIPSSVTNIGNNAFYFCYNLYVICNNSDLKFNIGSDSYGSIAKYAFMIYNKDGSTVYKESENGIPYYITSDGFAFSVENGEYILIKYIGNDETITLPLTADGNDYTVKMKDIGDAKNVIIPSGIIQINDNAFRNCQNLTSITISDSVTSIGDSAFSGCTSLTSVTVPDSVTSIGARAFYDCRRLKDVKLSNNITVISSLLFGHSGITSIIIPDSVTNIEIYTDMCAFYACELLEEIVVSAGNTHYKSAGNCIIDKNGTLVAGCGKSVIPDDGSVTRIGYQAFYGCGNIANITIPNSVTSIGARAFSGCSSVTNITIPDSVTSIEWEVFDASTHVEVDPNNPVIKDCGGAIFEGTALLHVNRDVESVTIPDGVTSIDDNAFSGCTNLTSITIPDSVTSIGSDAFKGCTNLTSITIPDSVTSIGSDAFKGCTNLTSITIPDSVTSIGNGAFYNCTSLTSIMIPNSVTSIGGGAFHGCASLTSITIQNGITSIEYNAFEGCTSLTSITIPDSVTSIGGYAFYGCSSLTSITIPESVTSIGESAFSGCTSLTNITIPDGVTSIGNRAFSDCTSLINITIPESVTSIGGSVFSDCSSLTSITIPNGVTSISGSAFWNCSSLENIMIPDGVTSIGGYAFYGCSSLTSITIPESVTSIGYGAFSGCSSLTSITMPESVTSIGFGAFSGCSGLKSITIPESVTSIGDSAFSSCSSLASITIPDSVTSIGRYAFSSCGNITSITIPESITNIGNGAFSGTKIYIIKNNSDIEVTFDRTNSYGLVSWYTQLIVDKNGNKTYREGTTDFELIDNSDGFIFTNTNGEYKLVSYIGQEETVTLPLDINGYEYKIYRMQGVRNVIIPDGMTSIGFDAFFRCSSLERIEIPDSVTSIGGNALNGCSSLTSITIPDSVTSIDGCAFSGCTSLTSITIPESVTSIGSSAFYGCTSLANIAISDGVTSIGSDTFDKTAYYNNSSNWDNGALYIGKLLIKADKDVERFAARNDTICIANDAFEECYKLRHIEVSGGYYEIFRKDYTTSNLETLVITDLPRDFNVYNYFGTSNIPLTLKTVILKSGVDVSNPHLFDNITGVTIYVEDAKIDCPWDHGCPGWNNGNKVFYGDEWARVKFISDGEVIADDVYLANQVIRPPYIADVKNEDTNRIFVGWDFDGDGQVDSLPATVLGEVEANAVYRTEDATYTIEFLDKNGNVLYNYILPYGAIIPEPTAPVAAGYVFLGWDGYYAGMSATADVKIASSWSHIGGGHDYVITVILPSCTTKGYTKHECSICGDSYMTDITEETGHNFGDWIISTKPTCSDDGIKYRVCHCGYTETDVAQSTGHSYEILSEVKATCRSGGYITYKCSSCGETMTEETNMLPHNYEKKYVSKSFLQWLIEHILNILFGYEGNNAYYYKCTVCGKIADVDDSAVIRTASAQEICEHEAGDWTVDSQYAHMEVRKCVKCDKIIESRNECRHNYVGSSWEAFGNSKIALSCRDCGELDIEDSLDAGKMTHTCTVNNNLTLNYYYDGAELLKEFDSFYLRVEKTCYNTDGSTYIRTTILYGDDNGDGSYKFRYNDILSYEVGDEIRATLVAVKNGVETERKADIYNIKTYAYNNLAKENVAVKSKTLLANMLNYCAQSQIYFNYRTDALVNAELTDEQRALYVMDSCEATVSNKGVKTTLDGATASVISRTLVLTSSIELKFYVNLRNYKNSDNIYDLSGISVKIEYTDMEGKLVNTVIDSSEFGYSMSSDEHSVRFAKLRATELRSVVEITILKDGKAISNTETYSVESFAHSQLASSSAKENTKELLKRMMIYSDCAVKYFDKGGIN